MRIEIKTTAAAWHRLAHAIVLTELGHVAAAQQHLQEGTNR